MDIPLIFLRLWRQRPQAIFFVITQQLEKYQLSHNKLITVSVVHTHSCFGEFEIAVKVVLLALTKDHQSRKLD